MKVGTTMSGNEAVLDHTAAIRVALSVIETGGAELETHRNEVARVLLRAVEGIEAVAGGVQ